MPESHLRFDFEGQTAIITGGTRGIGRAVAEAFLNAGGRVVAVYRSNTEEADALSKANRRFGGNLLIRQCDVSSSEETEALYNSLEKDEIVFQILVHCAGIRADSIVGLMKEEDWRNVLDSNLTGTFYMCKGAVQRLTRKRYGRLILITSPVGRIGFAGQSNYAATKAGQVAFMQSLSKEVAGRKITVNCVSPGFIDTDFIADLPDEQKKAYLEMVPLKRFGDAKEVASCVLFLASGDASYITGSVLEVTGGI